MVKSSLNLASLSIGTLGIQLLQAAVGKLSSRRTNGVCHIGGRVESRPTAFQLQRIPTLSLASPHYKAMAQCGDKPKPFAVGVAPLGIDSIGFVPMGVVGMGVVNACGVGMGVLVASMNAMGIWTFSPDKSHQNQSTLPAQENLMAYPSKAFAL